MWAKQWQCDPVAQATEDEPWWMKPGDGSATVARREFAVSGKEPQDHRWCGMRWVSPKVPTRPLEGRREEKW